MRNEKEIREKLNSVKADRNLLYEMYENDEIETKPYQESHATLCCIINQLEWVLGIK